jgi:hypothetical protein
LGRARLLDSCQKFGSTFCVSITKGDTEKAKKQGSLGQQKAGNFRAKARGTRAEVREKRAIKGREQSDKREEEKRREIKAEKR